MSEVNEQQERLKDKQKKESKEIKDIKKTAVILGVVFLFLAFLKFGVFAHIGVNTTESVYFRVYSYEERDLSIPLNTDQYIIFVYEDEDVRFVPKGTRIVKRVGCTAGQTVTYKDRLYFCDGNVMSVRKPVKSEKYGLIPFDNFTGVIPEGKIFVVGEHERSFDSRFYGVVDDNQITYTVNPIF